MASMRQIPDQSAWRIARCPVVFQECIQNFGILFPPTGEWMGADIRVAILLADTTDSMPAAPCYTVTVLFFRYPKCPTFPATTAFLGQCLGKKRTI